METITQVQSAGFFIPVLIAATVLGTGYFASETAEDIAETSKTLPKTSRNLVFIAAIAGGVYLLVSSNARKSIRSLFQKRSR